MSEYLTPKQVEQWAATMQRRGEVRDAGNDFVHSDFTGVKEAATLREHAAIVEGVVQADPGWWSGLGECPFCDMKFDDEADCYQHAPDCIWLRARKVRGYEL